MLQGGLELASQPALDLRGGRGAEQAGYQPGIGLQGRDLARVPVPRVTRVDVQGADDPAVQLHRDTQPRADPLAQQDLGELLPVGFNPDVTDGGWEALAERHRTGALG